MLCLCLCIFFSRFIYYTYPPASPRGQAEAGVLVEDRVGLALLYLPDASLRSYLARLCDQLTQAGDLDGVLLTGLTEAGIRSGLSHFYENCLKSADPAIFLLNKSDVF